MKLNVFYGNTIQATPRLQPVAPYAGKWHLVGQIDLAMIEQIAHVTPVAVGEAIASQGFIDFLPGVLKPNWQDNVRRPSLNSKALTASPRQATHQLMHRVNRPFSAQVHGALARGVTSCHHRHGMSRSWRHRHSD